VIYKIERGGNDPRLTSIRRLARALRVPPRELVERAPEPDATLNA